uniref:purine-nucleoside phosphorylase n=1 Tax=Craspedostauros australis TaxID=1486917 RepID=A0A7R9WNZ0_9STRA|mmetsp:Transcript_12521/g.34510  ORF Transcript_12521/g.34510 Transcript_12521/m.34510 type:complete len:373 (+) Transcript_12521:265-1383(+)|eukprot:CAMPEP_0198108226 /NCGR_PEP_ID=MMETSP1442-20131203/290_1 /TAXON_ID= /ORGANISM="Craspedostauros australis, Strain CCMP3328" /LENGTH=372 /DNA_ID=CAMNT_0043763455 /DNA_START=257 /DNA_END=1375 /DNA_ORIENTATION=-
MCRDTDNGPVLNSSHLPYRVAGSYLLERLKDAGIEIPSIGVICGSGLSGLSATLDGKTLTVKYSEIPGFPAHCTVAGHKGEVVFGLLSGVPAMCFRGRFHSYEGHDMKTVVLPVHVMRCLNVKAVIITNAAGGLNPTFNVGDVVCITDHLALPHLAGKNSLVGPNDDELGPRFPPTSNAYNPQLCQAVLEAAKRMKADFIVPHGTYCFVSGPMYESKSECHFLRSAGGDCVGMSTIPEVIAAHHCGMRVLCLSLITNKVVTKDNDGPAASHAEVLEAVSNRSVQMQQLVKEIIVALNKKILPQMPDLSPIEMKYAKMQYEREQKGGDFAIGADGSSGGSPASGAISMQSVATGALLFVAGSLATLLMQQQRR